MYMYMYVQYTNVLAHQTYPLNTHTHTLTLLQPHVDTKMCYTEMTFTVGQELELVFSTGLNPSNFSCQLHANTKLLETLMADIECTASDMSEDPPPSLLPGELILAQFSTDQKWYRAQVVSFDPTASGSVGSAEVLFVDYGNCERVPLMNIRSLPSDFLTLPKQSITCSLSGVKPSLEGDSKWRQEALGKLKELATECGFMTATIVGVSKAKVVKVSLRSSKCQDFSKALVESGFAFVS